MNRYINAIGFQHVKSLAEWNQILVDAENNATTFDKIKYEEGIDYCEIKKECGPRIGICSYGQINTKNEYMREYTIPYFEGTGITSYADILVEHRSDRESYVGLCEDVKVGVSIIFYLQNAFELIRENQNGKVDIKSTTLTLSGLANSGKILFPVLKSNEQKQVIQEESRNRMMLMSAARAGDTEAIESLTLDDIEMYTKVSRKLQTDDIYSIIDTYFMPSGVECEQYSILGEIIHIEMVVNNLTETPLYILTLDVNELIFDICVPVDRVMGIPEIGRRFKGDVQLQGRINFA